MPRVKTRLYVPEADLQNGGSFILNEKQAHYLRSVLRCVCGDYVGIFNGKDGEYLCEVTQLTKKILCLTIQHCIRPYLPVCSFGLICAVIKKTPMDFLIEKATELGAGFIQPVLTDRTVIREVNTTRLHQIAIEAAEQCGLTSVPEIKPLISLQQALQSYQNSIIYCDERQRGIPLKQLSETVLSNLDAILIGPEGGFSDAEAEVLLDNSQLCAVSLGTRILRAETAAISALSFIQMLKS